MNIFQRAAFYNKMHNTPICDFVTERAADSRGLCTTRQIVHQAGLKIVTERAVRYAGHRVMETKYRVNVSDGGATAFTRDGIFARRMFKMYADKHNVWRRITTAKTR